MIKDCPKRNTYFTQPRNLEKEDLREDLTTTTVKEEKEEAMEITEVAMIEEETKVVEATEDGIVGVTEEIKDVTSAKEVAQVAAEAAATKTKVAAGKEATQAE